MIADFTELDEFAVALERLFLRVLDECHEGSEDYDQVADWFSTWFNRLGIDAFFVRDMPDEHSSNIRFRATLRRASDGERSHFYLRELEGREFVRRMQRKLANRSKTDGDVSDAELKCLAIAIHCFLNESQDEDTFGRFKERFAADYNRE